MKKLLLILLCSFGWSIGQAQNVNVTFQVHSPDSTPVYVFGSWSNWTNWPGDLMTDIGNGYYIKSLSIPASATHEFLFVNGVGPTKEILDPAWSCTNGNGQYTNRVVTIGAADTTICNDWQSCNTCTAPAGVVAVTFQVYQPDSTPVYVFGSWSGWQNWPGDLMASIGNGYYATTLYLPSSTVYEFLYTNGVGPTKEVLDPAWPCTNGNGQYTNRVLTLGNADTVVCNAWQSCNTCTVASSTVNVTFRVASPDSLPVYIFGNWSNWGNWPGDMMTAISANTYEVTIPLTSSTPYEYLFVNGVGPTKEVLDPAWSCTNGNAQYTNRVFIPGASDTTICSIWSTCNTCSTAGLNSISNGDVKIIVSKKGILFMSSQYTQTSSIQIFDVTGRCIYNQEKSVAINNMIPVSLKTGEMYLIRCNIDGEVATFKAIISE